MNNLIIVLSFLFISAAIAGDNFDYKKTCTELSAEDQNLVKEKVSQLKNQKEIDQVLIMGLHKKENAADGACIVEKLNLVQLLPELVSAAERFNESTLWKSLAIVSEGQEKTLSNNAKKWLRYNGEGNLSRKILALQILGIAKVQLPYDEIIHLLNDELHEIRLNTFSYFTESYSLYSAKQQEAFLSKSLTSSPYQLRLMALGFYHQLNEQDKKRFKHLIKQCTHDQSGAVKKECVQ